MADIIDQANDRAEQDLQRAIAAAASGVPPLPFTGSCYNCDAILPASMRFCDADCCADFERRQRAEAMR